VPDSDGVIARFLDRADARTVEPLVAEVYQDLYGPRAWVDRPAHLRASIVRFVIDQVEVGLTTALVHTDRAGTAHRLPSAQIRAALSRAEPVPTPAEEGGDRT
jgi:hypothetical protein